LFDGGVSPINIKAGITSDAVTIDSLPDGSVLSFVIPPTTTRVDGDPVFSRLPNGKFALTSWSVPGDPPDAGNYLLYHEASCPQVVHANVKAIGPSHDAGCQNNTTLTSGKSSQIFANGDDTYLFHMLDGEILLAHIGDATRSAAKDKKRNGVCRQEGEGWSWGYGFGKREYDDESRMGARFRDTDTKRSPGVVRVRQNWDEESSEALLHVGSLARARMGGVDGMPRWLRIARMGSASVTTEMKSRRPSQRGQESASMS
jgi:hypothetical protein